MTKPIASLSLDLDDLWSYQRTHGDPDWEQRGSYLPALMPPLLDLLDERGCRITFFVVGADAADPGERPLASDDHRARTRGRQPFVPPRVLAASLRPGRRSARTSAAAEEAIVRGDRPAAAAASGARVSAGAPRCSRCSPSAATCTTPPRCRPTSGPLARAYFLATARLSAEQRRAAPGALRLVPRRLAAGRRVPLAAALRAATAGDPGHHDPGRQDAVPHELPDLPEPVLPAADAGLSARRAGAVPADRGRRPAFCCTRSTCWAPSRRPQLTFFPGMDVPAAHEAGPRPTRCSALWPSISRLVPMSVHAAQALAQDRLAVLEPHGRAARGTTAEPSSRVDRRCSDLTLQPDLELRRWPRSVPLKHS